MAMKHWPVFGGPPVLVPKVDASMPGVAPARQAAKRRRLAVRIGVVPRLGGCAAMGH